MALKPEPNAAFRRFGLPTEVVRFWIKSRISSRVYASKGIFKGLGSGFLCFVRLQGSMWPFV